MPRSDRPLQVDIPRPSDETPAWSRVGVVALVGFAVGILWPRFAGVRVGPAVPGASPDSSAVASASARVAAPPPVTPPPSASAAASAAPAANQQLVVVGPAKITKCYDKKDKKIEECDKVAFESIAQKKLKELATCPSALGLEGKMTIGIELMFDKKEVHVSKQKKGNTLPSSTIKGILDCAAKQFQSVDLQEVAHKHRRYNLQVPLTFYPPGKHPESEGAGGDGEDEKPTKGKKGDKDKGDKGDGEAAASGTATVSWDTALIRKEPKDGDVVTRVVRGTRVKIVSKQGDWFKVEANGKTGWIYRGAVGQ